MAAFLCAVSGQMYTRLSEPNLTASLLLTEVLVLQRRKQIAGEVADWRKGKSGMGLGERVNQ